MEKKLPWHPCMNEAAHFRVARLHLPVAEHCNIRCIYCSRGVGSKGKGAGPGKTEKILSPSEAVSKAESFLLKWGASSIIGIAGPGDPLANPATFQTLELLAKKIPGVNLCLCTNGLYLPENVERLQALGIKHLTVTVNGVSPEVVAKIQPRIDDHGTILKGRAGASLLIERQLAGIAAASARGIFVKVNTVVIPSINGDHIPFVARVVKNSGAKIFNPVPVLPGEKLPGMEKPSPGYMERIYKTIGATLPVFTKCKQCRADAEGIPGKGEIQCLKTA